MLLNRTLRLFLDSIGKREEYEFYLEKFQAVETICFALVCPEPEALEQAADVLVFDLQFLLRLDLEPLLLLAGVEEAASRHALREYGGEVALRSMGDFLDEEEGAGPFRAELERFIDESVRAGKIPALCTEHSAAAAAARLLPEVSRRVHLVRMRGPLHDPKHQVVPFLYTTRPTAIRLEPEDTEALASARSLLAERPNAHVSITSPIHLLEEMFTVRGAGTVLRKGSVIRHMTDLAALDRNRLVALLEQSFGRPLVSADVLTAVRHFYVESEYRAAALLEEHPEGAYLSKFAVGTEARGEGVAQELWREMAQDHAALFWRAREDNPINQWYEKLADGRHRMGGWLFFWRGIAPGHLPTIIDYCAKRPPDFKEAS